MELMNQKAEKMGLANTHFENPTGLFHPNHKSTAREIASIMAYAMNMKLCRKILLTQSYVAPCVGVDGKKFNYTLYHNLIVTRFEELQKLDPPGATQPAPVKIAAGKTGFTNESLYCLVTYAESADGHGYVCVTAKGDGVVTKVSQAKNFGRNAEIELDFKYLTAVDGRQLNMVLGEESKKSMEQLGMAAGASVAGMLVLGPIGIIGGAFVQGKNIDLPEGTELYIQTLNDEVIYAIPTTAE